MKQNNLTCSSLVTELNNNHIDQKSIPNTIIITITTNPHIYNIFKPRMVAGVPKYTHACILIMVDEDPVGLLVLCACLIDALILPPPCINTIILCITLYVKDGAN